MNDTISSLSERVVFWEQVMQETKKRWPTEDAFRDATVRELIDCCFDVHVRLKAL